MTKPRHEVMAEKVIAAIASGDVERLRPLFSKPGWSELQDTTRSGFRQLRERLSSEKIDLAKAKIVRVVPDKNPSIESVDVILEYQGRKFRTHFNVMTMGGSYDLMGVATWIAWDK